MKYQKLLNQVKALNNAKLNLWLQMEEIEEGRAMNPIPNNTQVFLYR